MEPHSYELPERAHKTPCETSDQHTAIDYCLRMVFIQKKKDNPCSQPHACACANTDRIVSHGAILDGRGQLSAGSYRARLQGGKTCSEPRGRQQHDNSTFLCRRIGTKKSELERGEKGKEVHKAEMRE